jgi:hypothetical protein
MKENKVQQNGGDVVETTLFGMPNWLAGGIFFLIAIGMSLYGSLRSARAGTQVSSLVMTLSIYIGFLLLRYFFLKLSAKILAIKSATWGNTLLVVGANAAFLMVLTFLGGVLGFTSTVASIILFSLGILVAIMIAYKALRISILETLALYALSLAMIVVVYVIVMLIFQVSLGSLF